MLNRGQFQLFAASPRPYSVRTIELVERSLVIDMLGLLTLDWRRQARWLTDPSLFAEAEFEKFHSSGISVFHPAVHFPAGEPGRTADRFFTAWNRFLEQRQDTFIRIERVEDMALAKSGGRIGVVLGLQDSDHLQSLDDVDRFYALGQRISQLTYNRRNLLGSGCAEPHDPGLTAFGVAVIQRMNETGMGIDVSHCGYRTTMDVFEASSRPVLITHANCLALVPGQPRCKPDDVLRKMTPNDGVIGITAIRRFVRRSDPVTLEHVLDHFSHVARLVGVEHVGLGSDTDLDGRDRLGAGDRDIAPLNHPRRVFDLVEGLIGRGFSDPAIELMLGGNFARVLNKIWRPAAPAEAR